MRGELPYGVQYLDHLKKDKDGNLMPGFATPIDYERINASDSGRLAKKLPAVWSEDGKVLIYPERIKP